MTLTFLTAALLAGCAGAPPAAVEPGVTVVDVTDGWARNSVNAVVFRKNSLVTHGDQQYVAFYDADARLVLGRRQLGSDAWTLKTTPFTGNARDAHNSISLMVDGAGYLHVAWDHHNNALRYARSLQPGGLVLSDKLPMTGRDERSVSYPEFYRQPDGGLLFFYRDGGSGRGNLVINRYDTATQAWTRLHANLISGEGRRNAYWQAHQDHRGTLHVSWVWRESPDVASNHDLAYARSRDGGRSWERSDGRPYTLPITAASAEVAARIPQGSELINQTSMSADRDGNPFIASYWRRAGSTVPQYQLVYQRGGAWREMELGFRRTPFTLSGGGTKAIPISRPQVMVSLEGERPTALLVFRDAERGSRVSVAQIHDVDTPRWTVRDLTTEPVGAWEPSFDTELWRLRGTLNLFLQTVQQVDGEGTADVPPSKVRVLQWRP
ncbi:BNR repeat-containing protein [Roseateles sp. DC23W]|uniref:BNR repeat-containing protein n=1 Tax=Pelomonas dachongensis TaxID=3299029 RepID=A0ABW7EWC1_9BURK